MVFAATGHTQQNVTLTADGSQPDLANVFGSGPYTSDSDLAMAARHAGLLQFNETGTFIVNQVGDVPSFSGSTANGVTTMSLNHPAKGITLTRTGSTQSPVTITPATATVTAGQGISFSASGGSSGWPFTWGGVAPAGFDGGVITFKMPGTFTVTVFRQGTTSLLPSNVATATVTVVPPTNQTKTQQPVFINTVSEEYLVGQTLRFGAFGGSGNGAYAWRLSNGQTGSEQFFQFLAPRTPGLYSVTVQRIGDSTAGYLPSEPVTKWFTISQPTAPPLTLLPVTQTVLAGRPASFAAFVEGDRIASTNVRFMAEGSTAPFQSVDGTLDNGLAAKGGATWNTPGTYTVRAFANQTDESVSTAEATVIVLPASTTNTLSIIPSSLVIDENMILSGNIPFQFTASNSTSRSGSFVWGGTAIPSTTTGFGTAIFQFATLSQTPGTYTVTVFQDAGGGFLASPVATAEVVVRPHVALASITPSSATITAGEVISFRFSGGVLGNQVQWDGFGGPLLSPVIRSLSFPSPGTYVVSATGIDTGNTRSVYAIRSASATSTVTVLPPTVSNPVRVNHAFNTAYIPYDEATDVNFSAAGGTGTGAYRWGGGLVTGTGDIKSIAIATPGTYTATVFRDASPGFAISNTAVGTLVAVAGTASDSQARVDIVPTAPTQNILLGTEVTFIASRGNSLVFGPTKVSNVSPFGSGAGDRGFGYAVTHNGSLTSSRSFPISIRFDTPGTHDLRFDTGFLGWDPDTGEALWQTAVNTYRVTVATSNLPPSIDLAATLNADDSISLQWKTGPTGGRLFSVQLEGPGFAQGGEAVALTGARVLTGLSGSLTWTAHWLGSDANALPMIANPTATNNASAGDYLVTYNETSTDLTVATNLQVFSPDGQHAAFWYPVPRAAFFKGLIEPGASRALRIITENAYFKDNDDVEFETYAYRLEPLTLPESEVASKTVSLSLRQPQSAVTITSPDLVVQGTPYTFTASGGSGTGAYTWGGAASGTGTSQTITFNSPGTSTVTVFRAADANYVASATAAASVTVTLPPQPSVMVSPTSVTVTAGGSATFTASGGSGAGAYTWGGSASGTGTTKTVTFPTAGTSTVTVFRAGDAAFATSNMASATVTVTTPQEDTANQAQLHTHRPN